MNSWIQTFSGEKVDPLNPDPRTLHIVDIAESLSKQCRFTGHTTRFYSTARHSINCLKVLQIRSEYTPFQDLAGNYWKNVKTKAGEKYEKVERRSALLHDASEAYLSDIARPVKHSGGMREYIGLEKGIELAVCERFRTTYPSDPLMKWVDNVMLRQEAQKLLNPKPLDDWHLTLPEFNHWCMMPEDWFVSEPVKDCNEFLDLYGQYQY